MNYLVQGNCPPEPAGYYDAEQRPLVIYHSPCLDGFTAAWACWLKHPDAEFVPGVYGQEPPNVAGRDVYLLDFSYKLPVMNGIIREARKVRILDHHKTAEADLASLWSVSTRGDDVAGIFDMEKSGARLAWEWFHPGVEVPLLVRLVEDRDLWRFALSDSKALNANFYSYEYDFEQWSRLRTSLEDQERYNLLLSGGSAIERLHMKNVRELVGSLRQLAVFKRVWDLHPRLVPIANLPYTMSSDAAGLMAEGYPFAATYYAEGSGQLVFSLRSRSTDGADVSEIATRYGGGGHRNAAGFRIASLDEL